MQPYLAVIAASPYALLIAVGALSYLLFAFLPWLPTQAILIIIAAAPLAEHIGYNPFVFGLVILTTLMPGVAPKIGPTHQLYSVATEERSFTFAQVKQLSWFHAAFILIGIVCSVPYWQMLGLIPR